MVNLISAIKEITDKQKRLVVERDREINIINKKYNKQIDELQIAVNELKKINTACYECNGTGKCKIDNHEGMSEVVSCSNCSGTGYKLFSSKVKYKDADDYDM